MKTTTLITIFLLSFSILFSQQTQPKDNIVILDSLSNKAAKSFCNFLKEKNINGANIHFNEAGYKSMFKIAVLLYSRSNNLTFASFDKNSQNPNTIDLTVKDFSITYSNYPDDADTIIRNARIEITGTYTDQNMHQELLPEIKFNEKDKIYRIIAENQSKKLGDYGNGTIPDPPKSFWREITEPVIIVSAAVVTVLLLFSVRSN